MKTTRIDGIETLKCLFPDEKKFVEYVIRNILFIHPDLVRKQAECINEQLRSGKALPVRYTSNSAFCLQHTVKTTPKFKNKSEAIRFTNDEANSLYHRKTGLRVCIDSDGNYAPKQAIYKYTQHRVSWGTLSTITNYIIAHIWNKTSHPLYFSLLWNYCLIPCPSAFLTDKRDDSHPVIKQVKDLIKAISIELYNPNLLINNDSPVLAENDLPPAEAFSEAKALIKENRIGFLPIL